jgi:hypothetical protein
LARMQQSGCFRFVRECLLHHQDQGGAERIVGISSVKATFSPW